MASSRFPGKPLAQIFSRPMVVWVAEKAAQAVGISNVFIATDSELIRDVTKESGFQSLMTSENELTGTDRVASAVRNLNYRTVVNVQGDEPLVSPEDILRVANSHEEDRRFVTNGFLRIQSGEDPHETSIPKIVFDRNNRLIYASRLAIPGYKDQAPGSKVGRYYKQVCIYAYSQEHLELFRNTKEKTPLERSEDIEVIRFLEIGVSVKMVECTNLSVSVDWPGDISKVENLLLRDPQTSTAGLMNDGLAASTD